MSNRLSIPGNIPFIKMHGAENDYVFIDGFATTLPDNPSALARTVSRRRAAIGADGLVFLIPPSEDSADVEMRIWNADGSSARMCGTAARCIAVWMKREYRVQDQCRIQAGDRVLRATGIRCDGTGGEATVNMGRVEVLPSVGGDRLLLGISATAFITVYRVDAGNPHAVVFTPELTDELVQEMGPVIECHGDFPDRTNVEFVVLEDDRTLKVRVWERGSGETHSCGSGACAAAAAAWSTGRLQADQPCTVKMPGGNLVAVRGAADHIFLSGPVCISHTGSLFA